MPCKYGHHHTTVLITDVPRSEPVTARLIRLPSAVAMGAVLAIGVLFCSDFAYAQRRRRPAVRRPATTTTTTTTASAGNGDTALTANTSADASAGANSTGVDGAVAASTTQPEVASSSTDAAADRSQQTSTQHTEPEVLALDVAVGMRWFGRFFSYHQDLFGELRDYSLPAAPMASAMVQWYPGAHFSRGPASYFGVLLSGALPFAISSRDSSGMQYGTTAYSFDLGIRGRIPLARHEIGLHATYGQQRFAIDNQGGGGAMAAVPGVPPVAYQHVRPGLSAVLSLSDRVSLWLSGSGLIVLSAGEITAQYFSRASVYGVEAQLGVQIAIASGFSAQLMAEARRYIYAMQPMVQDRWIAGGALDHYLNAGVMLAYRR